MLLMLNQQVRIEQQRSEIKLKSLSDFECLIIHLVF